MMHCLLCHLALTVINLLCVALFCVRSRKYQGYMTVATEDYVIP